MFVDPATPLAEIVRSTLFGDALECPDTKAVVKGDGDSSFLSRLGMSVLQNRVVTTCPIVTVAEFLEDVDDLPPREVS